MLKQTIILATLLFSVRAAAEDAPPDLQSKVTELARELEADSQAERDAAQKKLVELAGSDPAQGDALLALVPQPNDQMSPDLRARLEKVRRQIDEQVAHSATVESTLTLDTLRTPIAEVLKQIETQTGNKVIDYREQFGQQVAPVHVTINARKEPFWQVMDKLLDQTGLVPYNFAGENALALVTSDPGGMLRTGRASYLGPFRLEVITVDAHRNQRRPTEQSLQLTLEVAWEPRLRPIAISQPLDAISAIDETGAALRVGQPTETIEIEVQPGSQATELVLPFQLPSRDVGFIAALRGKMLATIPGRIAKFEFADLEQGNPRSEVRGGVTVTLQEVRKNNDIWEVHMRMKLADAGDALASHRGWVFQNFSYLVNEKGEKIDNAGFETTLQTESEVGIAYLFDLPDGLKGLRWVYECPAAIISLPIEYELEEIELP